MSGCARGPRDRYACAKSTAFRSGWAGPGLSFLQVAESKVQRPACSTTSPSWPQAKCAPSPTTPALLAAERRKPRLPRPARRPHRRAHPTPSSPSSSSWPRPGAADPSTRSPARSKGRGELPDAGAPAAGVVDTIVITTAVRHYAPVVTGDAGDLTRIADCIGVKSGSSQPDQHPEPLNGSRNVDDGVRSRPSGDTGHRQCGS